MKSVNIKDIAKAAGVGVSTVSRVLNDQPDVKASTKSKVLKVIEELNYIPNNSARNLKRTKTNHIGIFIVGEYSSFFSKIVEAIELETAQERFALVLHFHKENEKTIESAVEFALEKRLAGLIILGGSMLSTDAGYLDQLDIPIVLGSTVLNHCIARDKYNSVTIDNFHATYEGLKKLLLAGHEKIALISTDDGIDNVANKRYQAYKKILQDNNLSYDEKMVAMGDYSIESGYHAMDKLLNQSITAVFAISDLMAIGAVKRIVESGLRVPEDISVLGFDGLEISHYMIPSLSTIEQPYKEMGIKIADIMLRQIGNHNETQHIVLETSFIEGQTIKYINEV